MLSCPVLPENREHPFIRTRLSVGVIEKRSYDKQAFEQPLAVRKRFDLTGHFDEKSKLKEEGVTQERSYALWGLISANFVFEG